MKAKVKIKTLFFIMFCLYLPACEWSPSKGIIREPEPSTGLQAKDPIEVAKKRIQTIRQNFRVECPNQDCPPFVAALFLVNQTEKGPAVAGCSGTLIGKNRILTNAHCIPKEAFSSCESVIDIHLPALPEAFPYEKYSCHKIHSISPSIPEAEDPELYPDWAVVEWKEKTQRPPAPLQLEGIQHGQKGALYKADFLWFPSRGSAVITKTHCTANNHYFLNKENMGPYSPLFNVSHCSEKLNIGNSGSGLISETMGLLGVLSFIRPVEDSEKEWAQKLRDEQPRIRQNHGGGTNLSCVEAFQKKSLPASCQVLNNQDFQLYTSFYQKIYQTKKGILERPPSEIDSSQGIHNTTFLLFDEDRPAPKVSINGSILKDKPLQAFLLNELLSMAFPKLPKCIPDHVPSVFSSRLRQYKTDPMFRKDDNSIESYYWLDDKLRAYRLFHIEDRDFLFEQQSNGTYKMETTDQKPLFPKMNTEIFSFLEGSIEVFIPLCE